MELICYLPQCLVFFCSPCFAEVEGVVRKVCETILGDPNAEKRIIDLRCKAVKKLGDIFKTVARSVITPYSHEKPMHVPKDAKDMYRLYLNQQK